MKQTALARSIERPDAASAAVVVRRSSPAVSLNYAYGPVRHDAAQETRDARGLVKDLVDAGLHDHKATQTVVDVRARHTADGRAP